MTLAADADSRVTHLQEMPEHETTLRDDDDESGLIELMQEVEHSATGVTAVLVRICGHKEGIGRTFVSRATEMNQLTDRRREVELVRDGRIQQKYTQQLKDVADQAATHLQDFADQM